MNLKCRFYENELPAVGDAVVVDVNSIQNMGAYVSLLEYEGIEGMILLSELSRRRIRSVNKLLRVGRKEIVVVVRVDHEKRYIDLSKRQVSREEIESCEKRYADAKSVNQILTRLAHELKFKDEKELEELFMKTAWHFDNKGGRKAASYDYFKQTVTNPEVLDECNLEPEVKERLLSDIKRKLMPQAVKIRNEFEVSCFTSKGIQAIKSAIEEGLKLSTSELEIKINLIASPCFVMTCQTLDRELGVQTMNKVIDVIRDSITQNGGSFKVTQETKIVTDHEDLNLQKRMQELEEMNAEVSGDDSRSESEEEEEEEAPAGDIQENGH